MKPFYSNFFFLLVAMIWWSVPANSQIWEENFNGYGNGTFNAPPKWTSIATDCDDLSINEPGESMWGVYSGQFTVNDIEGLPCCNGGIEGGGNDNSWTSEIINLIGYCDISISLEVFGIGNFECNDPGFPIFGCSGFTPPDNSHDQVVVQYSLDGGGWTQFGYVCGLNGTGPISVSGLNGTTLQIRFYAACKSNGETYTIDNIVVNGSVGGTPTFTQIGPLCETGSIEILPTASIEGITGTWDIGPNFDPSGLGGTITTIVFTPDPSFCASQATMDIEVLEPLSPIALLVDPFCETDPSYSLDPVSNGINGSWSGPGVTTNEFDPAAAGPGTHVLFYTPDPGECAFGYGLIVEVNPVADPTLGTATICDNDPPFDLTSLEDPLYPGGTWSGQGVNGNFFDPTGLLGTIVLTFTSNAPCTNDGTTTITVNMSAIPALLPGMMCENGDLFDLTFLQDPLYPMGTWSGPGVTGNFFNPNGLPGINVLTFTSSEPCVAPATTDVTVEMTITPSLGTASLCETEGPLDLTTLEDPMYPGGTWFGPGVSGNTFEPAGLNGPIELNFISSMPCFTPTTTIVFVNAPATPNLGSANICESSGLFDLTTIQDPLFPDGVWSGPGVSGSTFDPTGQSGPIGIVFTSSSSCTLPANTFMVIEAAGTPDLGSATLCENEGFFYLTTLQDPGYPNGTWSGIGVVGNEFDPSGLSGNIDLTFTPTGNCVLPSQTTITVNLPMTPSLGTATLCETGGQYNLSNIADPSFPTGAWSGNGVTGNNFNPNGQTGNVLLTFTPSANCTEVATTFITVNAPAQPDLGVAETCQNSGLFDLNSLIDPNYPTGTWNGVGVSGSNFDPAGQSGLIPVSFTPTTACTIPDTTNIQVYAAPSFSNLDENCDLATQTYTVTFDISGGSFPPYTVDGVAVMGNTFTSAAIPSGTNYSFDLNDGFGCGPVTISGSANCNCGTDAGTMDFTGSPLLLCHGENIPVNHLGDEFLEIDDNLIFVLHTNAGSQLGTVLASSPTSPIPYPGNLTAGQTYYISAVAGNDDGNGGIDLSDPCLSVSPGVPVTFYRPTAQLNAPTNICANDCFDFSLQLTGTAPFIVDYTITGPSFFINEAVDNVGNSVLINFCPSDYGLTQDSVVFGISGLNDNNNCDNYNAGGPTTTLYISESVESNFNPFYCPGESIAINGTLYDESNPMGMETIIGGSVTGCDSIVNIDLVYYPPATEMIEETLCTGGSLIVNGTVYDESNPDGVEVIPNGSAFGCDSTITVELSFNNEVFANFSPKLCPGGSVTVNGTVYNAGNPSGSETFPNGSLLGCDSTVLINLSFFQPASSNISPELCPGGSIVINGTVYDETNPSGTEILPGASVNGCDSTINVSLSFTNAVTSNFTATLCPAESVIINGTVYDSSNPSGSETFPNGSVLGCDSIVNIALAFFNEATSEINDQLCTGSSITVNGTVYDEANPTGSEIIMGGSVDGCDSTITVALSFTDEVFGTVDPTLCPGETVVVNGTVFDENSPTGMVTLPGGSILGCDSTIMVDLSFFDENVFDLIQTLCPGESLTVNGTVYNEANPDGTEILPNASVNGCDSTIEVALDFYLASQVVFEPQLCTGGSITINGTIYDENNPSGMEILPNADVNGCDSTVFVNIDFTDEVVANLTDILCPGEVLVVNGTIYSESNLTGSETFPNGSALGCDSTVFVEISYYPEAIGTISETLVSGSSIIINGTVYNQSNPSGTEILLGASVNGCDSTIIVSLEFEGGIAVDFAANSTACEFGNDGSIVIESITGGMPPYVIALNGGSSATVAVFPYIFDNLENGFYQLTVIDANNLVHTEEIFLPFPDPPFFDLGDDLFIDLGESIILSAQLDFTPASYFWEPDSYLNCTDCEMPLAVPADDITYLLTVTDENGCTFSDEVSVFVQKARNVYAPTAFSPNNDAMNDEFTLFTGQQVSKINNLLIFDRWGALLFEQYNFEPNNLSIGWNGQHKGQMMNPGVYVWFAEVEFLDGEVGLYEGEVILIR